MSISSLKYEISQYNALKSRLNTISESLNGAAQTVADVPNSINNVFTLDENSTKVSTKCTKLNNDIVSTSNYIKSVVIPGIDNAINRCWRNIAKLEAEEKAKADAALSGMF